MTTAAPTTSIAASTTSIDTSERLQLDDIQGNVVRGYNLPLGRYYLLRVDARLGATHLLGALVGEVTDAQDWQGKKPESTLNLAFTHDGLRALGLTEQTLASFPTAFRMGMKKRAAILGDTGSSAPPSWSDLWKRNDLHVLVSLHASDELALERRARFVTDLVGHDRGMTTLGHEDAALLMIDGKPSRKEHFGFSDGFGQTEIRGARSSAQPGSGKLNALGQWEPLAPGELLLGYEDETGEKSMGPSPDELARNGTFLAFRKLRQHVQLFRDYLDTHGATYPGGKEKLAAKFVGRWRDGTPLVLSPDRENPAIVGDDRRNNDFLYADDPDGARCPLGAHIRRARPRDAMGFGGRLAVRRRIVRRGLPYGKWAPEGAPVDGQERGILFMALNVDFERQFEFIQQQWLNYGNHFQLGNDKDVITGDHDGTGKAIIHAEGPNQAPFLCTGLPRFVDTRGGEYFFVPGIEAMRWMARAAKP